MTPIDRLHYGSLKLPPKLQAMVARYIEGARDGRDPVKLFRNGARVLNATFKRADAGDDETLEAMRRDRIDGFALCICAELFATAALALEKEANATVR